MVTTIGRMVGTDDNGKVIFQYAGESTDTKPTETGTNSLFLELDTKDVYYYDGSAWAKVGG